MKVFIVHASAGAGHRRSAEAVYNYFKENCSSHQVQIIDVLDKTHPLFKKLYSWGYLFLVHHATWAWQLGFWFTSLQSLKPLNDFLNFLTDRLNAKEFSRFLIFENSDHVITTHFMPSEITAYLKKKGMIKSKLTTIVTDFAVHPYWIYEGTDTYVVAPGFARQQLISAGVKEEQIKEFGIPVDAKFLLKYDRSALAAKFGISKDKFTCLLVTGSFGLGPIEKISDRFSFYQDIQLLVVCARNKSLYQRLVKKNYPNAKVFGFVDNIEEMMAVSDIVITKPGGLTISEVLAMELPPVFISPIPGQETKNIEVLRRYGIGDTADSIATLEKIILDYKTHPDKLSHKKGDVSIFSQKIGNSSQKIKGDVSIF
ncbi:MAG: glycosyltransferase [Candidatus Omnitrophota bacterium]